MTSLHRFWTEIKRKWRSCKGISPVIAAVLLIGVSIVGGAIILGLMVTVFGQEEPYNVQFIRASNFKSTETQALGYDSTVDYLEITLQNLGQESVFFQKTDLRLYRGESSESGTILPGWWVDDSRDRIILNGGEIITIPLTTIINSQELTSGEYAVIDILEIRKLDRPDEFGYQDFNAESFKVDDTYGPVVLTPQSQTANATHWVLNYTITNYGTKDIEVDTCLLGYNTTAFQITDTIITLDLDGSGGVDNTGIASFVLEKTSDFNSDILYLFYIQIKDSSTNYVFGYFTDNIQL
ncbi:MAG: hypothetical protein ACTSP4_06885 [Candidatus Hodarchaeales archaeon]